MPLFWITLAAAAVIWFPLCSFPYGLHLRPPRGVSIVHPHSQCTRCGHTLHWFENIPLLSFILLLRRCRGCGQAIGWQYPAVELSTCLWFAWSAIDFARGMRTLNQPLPLLLLLITAATTAILGFLLLGLMIMDWQTHLLPNLFTLGGLAAGLALAIGQGFLLRASGLALETDFQDLRDRAMGAAIGFVLPWSIGEMYRLLRRRRGIGLGDSKMLATIGAFVGIGPMLLAFLLGVLLAAAFGMGLLLRGRATATTRLPFGSFLAAGGLISAVCGETVVNWYLSLFR